MRFKACPDSKGGEDPILTDFEYRGTRLWPLMVWCLVVSSVWLDVSGSQS